MLDETIDVTCCKCHKHYKSLEDKWFLRINNTLFLYICDSCYQFLKDLETGKSSIH